MCFSFQLQELSLASLFWIFLERQSESHGQIFLKRQESVNAISMPTKGVTNDK